MNPGERQGGKTLDRRQAITRAAAAGAVVWSAPVVMSSPARAMDGACTPKCVPVAGTATTPGASLSCLGNGSNRVVTVVLTNVNPSPVTCPCGGTAVLGPLSVTSSTGRAVVSGTTVNIVLGRSAPQFTVTVSQTASCDDRADDPCALTCTTVFSVSPNLQDNGNCRGTSPGVSILRSGCS